MGQYLAASVKSCLSIKTITDLGSLSLSSLSHPSPLSLFLSISFFSLSLSSPLSTSPLSLYFSLFLLSLSLPGPLSHSLSFILSLYLALFTFPLSLSLSLFGRYYLKRRRLLLKAIWLLQIMLARCLSYLNK
jgi:hypothetical protein